MLSQQTITLETQELSHIHSATEHSSQPCFSRFTHIQLQKLSHSYAHMALQLAYCLYNDMPTKFNDILDSLDSRSHSEEEYNKLIDIVRSLPPDDVNSNSILSIIILIYILCISSQFI